MAAFQEHTGVSTIPGTETARATVYSRYERRKPTRGTKLPCDRFRIHPTDDRRALRDRKFAPITCVRRSRLVRRRRRPFATGKPP